MINIDKYIVAAKITENHMVSKLRIIISKFMLIWQFCHVKNVKVRKIKHVKNGHTDFLVTIIELLRLLHST